MRWFWIDKFVEFESGQRAVAVKNVTLGEQHVSDYFPGDAVLPASLVIEGLAQTGGVLVAEARGFERRVVLAKVSSATFHRDARAGDQLRYTTTIGKIDMAGAIVSGRAEIDGVKAAEAKLVFAHLGHDIDVELFQPVDLLKMLQLWQLFNVGRQADGSPLSIPDHLRETDHGSEVTTVLRQCR